MTEIQTEMIRRLRLGDLRRLFRDRCRGSTLPDDDAGRDYLKELLLPISVGPYEAVRRPGKIELWGPTERMRREIELWAPWMQKDEVQALIDEINQMPMWQRKPNARTLGERLNVPYAERERLRLRTILPCDVSDRGVKLLRKKKRREREKLRRLNKGKQSRAEYLANHKTSKEQPWKVKGISRATWYRQQRETSPCPMNLKQRSLQPVSQENRLVSKGKESGERSLLVSSIQSTPESEKAEMSVTDKDNELMTRTCLTSVPEMFGHNGGPPMDAVTNTLQKRFVPMEWNDPQCPISPEYSPVGPEQDLRGMPKDLSCYYARPSAQQFDMAA